MIDQFISTNIINLQSPSLTKFMIFITNIGDKYAIAIFSIIIISLLVFHKKDYIRSKTFMIAMTLGIVFSQALKYLISRPRPEIMLIEQGGYSMPSGHSTLSMIFFGMMIYLFIDEIKNEIKKYSFIVINILLIILIGFSRIYLNVHYFSDVVVGFILGIVCIISSIYLSKKIIG